MSENCTMDDIKVIRKDLKRHLKMSALFMPLFFSIIGAGAFLFFYIEHCYDARTTQWNDIAKNYFQMCRLMQMMPKNITTAHSSNFSAQNWSDTMSSMCNHADREMKVARCNLDLLVIMSWIEFCTTVGYTIGYGYVVPLSDTGKIVTILYAIPAIGLTMTFNIYLGRCLVDATKILIILLETKLLRKNSVSHLTLKVFLNQVLMTVLVCILNALGVRKLMNLDIEGNITMTYTDAIYFTFVSMSTIGFGDIPRNYIAVMDSSKVFETAFTMVTFCVGMAVMGSVLAGLSDYFTIEKKEGKQEKENVLKMFALKNKRLKQTYESHNNGFIET